MKMKRFNIPVMAILVCAAILFAISCAVNPVTGKKQIMLMSEAQEIQMGISYDPQVMATFGEYRRPQSAEFCSGKRNRNRKNLSQTEP